VGFLLVFSLDEVRGLRGLQWRFVRPGASRVVNLLPQVKIEAQLGPGVRRDSRTCDLSRAWPLPATPLT
jgi:hypothetical protein